MKWPLIHFLYHVPYMTLYFIPFSRWTMKGFLTSTEGRTAPDKEGKANLMNGLIDGYRDGGRDWCAGGGREEGILVVTIKSLSILCKALLSLVEMYSMKTVIILAVAEQDWQSIWVECLPTFGN